jgi:hypothetical protein
LSATEASGSATKMSTMVASRSAITDA